MDCKTIIAFCLGSKRSRKNIVVELRAYDKQTDINVNRSAGAFPRFVHCESIFMVAGGVTESSNKVLLVSVYLVYHRMLVRPLY